MDPCDLYIVRHAIAAERGDEWPDDTKRPLTEEASTSSRKRSKDLSRSTWRSTRSLPVPSCARSRRRTLLAHGLGNKIAVKTLDVLAPGHTPRQVMNELSRAAKRHRIALVGHERDSGAGRPGDWRAAPLPFKKGGVCYIAIQGLTSRRPGELVWFLPRRCCDDCADSGHHQSGLRHRRAD
jgi:phosphohistidine phosphatase SixA